VARSTAVHGRLESGCQSAASAAGQDVEESIATRSHPIPETAAVSVAGKIFVTGVVAQTLSAA
jgi:hypothetical protein